MTLETLLRLVTEKWGWDNDEEIEFRYTIEPDGIYVFLMHNHWENAWTYKLTDNTLEFKQ